MGISKCKLRPSFKIGQVSPKVWLTGGSFIARLDVQSLRLSKELPSMTLAYQHFYVAWFKE